MKECLKINEVQAAMRVGVNHKATRMHSVWVTAVHRCLEYSLLTVIRKSIVR